MRYNFKYYCKDYENIENYDKAKANDFKNWEVHHRLETHNSDGERRLVDITADELKALDMYYNRPADELIFIPIYEHSRLHMKGKHLSEETRKKIGEAKKGEKNPNYGKHHSEETRKKMREARKGKQAGEKHPMYGKHHSEESKKKMREALKVLRWFNNGKINVRVKECPEGFVPGRIKKL